MSIASDVQAVTLTANGDAVLGRTRIQGVYYTCDGTASAIVFKTGGSSGTTILELKTPGAAGAYDLIIPDDGILAKDGLYVAATDNHVLSATILFVGGKAA